MFHARDGLYFRNNCGVQIIMTAADGQLHVVDGECKTVYGKVLREVGITIEEFASVIASMSRRGETSETYQEAYNLLIKPPRQLEGENDHVPAA